MSKEIVVNKGDQTRIAIVEDGTLAELFIENQEHERTIGNIFLGRIRRTMPSIQAAFVDIGQKQDAFLHFSDLIENVEDWMAYVRADQAVIGKFEANYTTRPAKKKRRHPSGQYGHRREGDGSEGSEHHHVADEKSKERRKSAQRRQHGKHGNRIPEPAEDDAPYVDPAKILKKDQIILVKISKEPIANKGSRITTDISLAGRFLVLVPMANYVAVSKKIFSFKERRRLRTLARSLLPEGFGVIVRTVADGRSAKSLDTDLNLLIDKWKKIEERLKVKPSAPVVVHEDVNMVSSIMRDLFTEDYDRILIDDQRIYRNIKGYVQAIAPQMVSDVVMHKGSESVFQKVGIAQEVQEAFDSRVNLPSGGYLFIEQTEAMHVIDVNSGRAGRGLTQEENSLRVNVEAAKVLCKQVRLRDLGGIIVVDFIDMRIEKNRRKVFEVLRSEFMRDRAVTKVLTMSDFGLIQITRQRLRPSFTHTFSHPDQDSGSTASSRQERDSRRYDEPSHLRVNPQELKDKIELWLSAYKKSGLSSKVRLVVHPFTAAYFNGGFITQAWRWFLKYGVRVKVEAESRIDPLSFRFIDDKSNRDISRLPRKQDVRRARGSKDQPMGGAKHRSGSRKNQGPSGRPSGKVKSPSRERGNIRTESKTRSADGGPGSKKSGGANRSQGRGQKRSQDAGPVRDARRNESAASNSGNRPSDEKKTPVKRKPATAKRVTTKRKPTAERTSPQKRRPGSEKKIPVDVQKPETGAERDQGNAGREESGRSTPAPALTPQEWRARNIIGASRPSSAEGDVKPQKDLFSGAGSGDEE